MEEYKFQLVITPESYDYGEEEIVYRIYFNKQLISERSLPVLRENQGIIDSFFLNLEQCLDTKNIFYFENLKNKKAKPTDFFINNYKTNYLQIEIKYEKFNFTCTYK